MKYITSLFVAATSFTVTSSAAIFGNPSLALYPPLGPLVLGPAVGVPLVSSVVDDLGNFASTLTSTIHTGGSNPLGGLTFVYTLSNDLVPLTAGNDLYAFGVLWNSAFVPALIDVDTVPPGVGVTPFSFGFGTSGISFSFNFVSLPVGLSSVSIAIGTSAPSWTLGDAGIINGTTEDALAYVPVPEPISMLACAGMLGAFVLIRRRL